MRIWLRYIEGIANAHVSKSLRDGEERRKGVVQTWLENNGTLHMEVIWT